MTTNNSLSGWKLFRQVNVGMWKAGWIASDNSGNLRLLISTNEDLNLYRRSLNYFAESVDTPIGMTRQKSEEQYDNVARRLERNLKAFAGVKHAHIAEFIEIQKGPNNRPAGIMEYCAGDEITTALRGAELPVFISHFKQAFEALSFIHDQGLLVLRWKPNSLPTDIIRGITKFVALWDVHTAEDIRIGEIDYHPWYAAPELIFKREIDTRADLYSIAVLMLEAWQGTDPVFEETRSGWTMEILERTMTQKEKEPDVMERGRDRLRAPQELGPDLVLKLLKNDPDARGFRSASEVVNYIVDTWPEVCKPANELYGKVMTTTRR